MLPPREPDRRPVGETAPKPASATGRPDAPEPVSDAMPAPVTGDRGRHGLEVRLRLVDRARAARFMGKLMAGGRPC